MKNILTQEENKNVDFFYLVYKKASSEYFLFYNRFNEIKAILKKIDFLFSTSHTTYLITMTTFRLATINVHRFTHPVTYDNNIQELVAILKPYNLDLIAVQEINCSKSWSSFCNLLGLDYFVFGPSESSSFGNGIASRYPIKSSKNIEANRSKYGATRSLLQVNLDGSHPFVKDRIFSVTHLDHRNENYRLEQIRKFDPLKNSIDILMGDMNSLTRDDYSDNYYQTNVYELREKSEWEKPCFDVTQLIKNQWTYIDAFKQINPDLKDEQIATCRFGTRIDYIYLRPRLNDSWILEDCSIIDTKNATDHNVIFAVFKMQEES